MDRTLTQTSLKQLRRFLGMVNFYRHVFEKRSHILSPLNDLAASTAKKERQKAKTIPHVTEA